MMLAQKKHHGSVMFSLGILNLLLHAVSSFSTSQERYYTAAVYEHVPLGNSATDTPQQIIAKNLDMYQRAIDAAGEKGADIIIFPECGIFMPQSREEVKKYLETVPDPGRGSYNPCNEASEFSNRTILRTLSCMAQQHHMVVVANMGDIQPCVRDQDPHCPEDGNYMFNTNVAFDRDGTLLSRYHKMHLFMEDAMDIDPYPQNPVLKTDIGYFAMFICFDVLFKDIMDAAQNETVDNVILSTMWFNTLPLLSSIQLWESFALGNGVTFLASNIQRPGYGNVGSGIFSGVEGALKYTFNPDGLSKLVVSKVPRSRHQIGPFPDLGSSITIITSSGTKDYPEDEDGKDVPELCSSEIVADASHRDYRCYRENTANYTFVKLTEPTDSLQVCNNGMCCSLNYSTLSMDDDFYLGIFNGTYNALNRYYWCLENCLLVRCDSANGTSCNTFALRSKTVFTELEMKANFTTRSVYPHLLTSGNRLVPKEDWNYALTGDEGRLSLKSTSLPPLTVAALNGRCYDRDPPYRK